VSTSAQESRVTEVFDRWAEAGKAEGMERSHGPAARRAFDMLGLADHDGPFRYLDVGCGNGYTVRWAAALLEGHEGGLAVGLDGSERMVQRARGRAENTHQRFVHALFPDHGQPELLAPASFDAAFSMEVFYYLPSLEAGLAEVARLLKPGGRFACVVDHYAENPASHGWPAMLGVEMDLRTEAQWRAAFAEAGLELVHQGRLRAEPGSTEESWKVEQGSLLTLGRRRA
jgi:SAM-dependent methyltransferase